MPATDLDPLLNAASVAVVGASPRARSFGGQVLRNLVDMGYAGRAYGVHPRETDASTGCARCTPSTR